MAHTRSHTRRRSRSNPRGVLSVHGGNFGFVQTAEGAFFIPSSKMAGAFDGDLVEVAPLPAGGSKGAHVKSSQERGQDAHSSDQPAARVVRVIDRAHDTLVGRYEVAEPFGVVVPEDARIPYDIFTMRANHPEVEDGSLVRVRITSFPARNTAATGVVEEVLGRAGDESAAVELIIARHKLETQFSEAALEEARSATLQEDRALMEGYRDLRERFTFTVDPVDARDFDDAVSLEPLARGCEVGTCVPGAEASSVGTCVPGAEARKGSLSKANKAISGKTSGVCLVDERGLSAACWRLGVHIADVSHYVEWNSSLDLDARRRATSVYLVDRVIPMLPEELSGDLCSLRPHEVRRTMTADLYLDAQAKLVGYEIYPALICSKMRLTYEQAQEKLDSLEAAEPLEGEGGQEDTLGMRLGALSCIAKQRIALRSAAGGLDFATSEAKVRLDVEGHPVSIDMRSKTEATSFIEEAMILANETVAQHLRDAKFPGLFRIHDQPASESLARLVPVFQEFIWFKDIDQQRFVAGDAHVIEQVLATSAGRVEGELVSALVLRSMKRAVYRPECGAHYGLASNAYVHFTSPIRRYPDLVVHRMLKAQIGRRPEKFDQEVVSLTWIAEHSSDMERVAEKAARESQELKIVEYMEQYIGQAFSAVISGVTTYGLYVRLENTAEGLVHVKDLGSEYFAFDPTLYRLVGQETGAMYRLGQRVVVILAAVDVRAVRLDFRPVR